MHIKHFEKQLTHSHLKVNFTLHEIDKEKDLEVFTTCDLQPCYQCYETADKAMAVLRINYHKSGSSNLTQCPKRYVLVW